jgi:hypothetical protein
LADVYSGVPALVAGAGPSLDAVLPQLGGVHERALVVACDTALRPLLTGGVEPQLVAGVDPSALNARHMLSLPECASTWLVAESALDRAATTPFDGRTFWFRVSHHEPWPWLNELGLDIGQIDVWGSVLTAAFQIAHLAGCDPIVFVGADLSFTDARPYARGTTYEFDWALSTANGMRIEEVWRQQISAGTPVAVPDLQGRDTIATPSLVSFRDWLVARASRSGRRVVNAGGAGILAGPGVEQGTIREALPRARVVPAVAQCAGRRGGVRVSELAARVREAHAIVADGDSTHSLYARWREFSGEGFDPRALSAALAEAASALETSHARPSASGLIPWPRLFEIAPGMLTGLPDALARLRVAMSGTAVLAPINGGEALTEADRRTLLLEALRLLGRIRDELSRIDDLPPPTAPWHLSRLPASVVCAWPEPLRWAVEIFEGLLGRAWVSGSPTLQSAFFARAVKAMDADGLRQPGANGTMGPQSTHACMLLLREWLECWSGLETNETARASLARFIGLESAVRGATGGDKRSSALTMQARAGSDTVTFELPLQVAESALGRVLTGTIVQAPSNVGPVPLPRVDTPHLRASVSIDFDRAAGEASQAPARVSAPRLLTPESERWAIAYPLELGVVCVRLNDTTSFVLHEDGHMEPHHRWPRAIMSELPLGDHGALAWASGRADPSHVVSPYVMYRRDAGADPIIEDLPFNPSWGAWWEGRVYWGYLPSDAQPGRGLGSWAPEGGARIELTGDFALFDLRPDATGLVLEPSTRLPDNSYERRRLSQGWRWDPVRGLQPRALGPHGAAGCRVVANGITTTTFPEADLVSFEDAEGTILSMIVYRPFRAAWLGRSLVVGTVDYELLLFENVLDGLGAGLNAD